MLLSLLSIKQARAKKLKITLLRSSRIKEAGTGIITSALEKYQI